MHSHLMGGVGRWRQVRKCPDDLMSVCGIHIGFMKQTVLRAISIKISRKDGALERRNET